MKALSKILFILIFSISALLFSCKEKVEYPIIPYIEYVNFLKIDNLQNFDDKGILKFSFTDGDGDIGLAPSDTLYPYNTGSQWYYNLFITYYEKQKGTYVAVELPMTNNSRIPVVTPHGVNKSIKGDVEIELNINNYNSPYDTICFDVQIADRSLNLSNTIRTPDIIIKK
ncbi:MAG TPA: hypothetical protein PKK00_00550 [Bacteroidales bacterium]|nr:hypothetical protein [Bacteroidales bacterium]HPS16003.1 hypothetical protein [Bacteroidales bacterium]